MRRHVRWTGAFTACAMILSCAVALPAAAQPYRPLSAQPEAPVAGHSFKPKDSIPLTSTGFAAPPPTWPAASNVDVALPGRRERQSGLDGPVQVSGLPLRVRAGDAASARLRVESFDRATTVAKGVDGVLMRLSRADGVTDPRPVTVTVDYNAFRWAYGGDWASRLSLHVDGQRVPSVNDSARGTVEATVHIGEGSMVAVASTASGAGGDYRATSLSPSATWSAGGNSGDFGWGYALRTPPGLGGPVPDISFDYSSSSVDGRMASANNQPSWIGEGFDYHPGFIERRYNACADDLGSGSSNTTKTGDLCWETDNASLSLSGHAGELIKDATNPNRWHLREDDGTYVERKTGLPDGGTNGDNDAEWWLVRTSDGTQYWFGGRSDSNATLTVPVYGNHSGEPCRGGSFATSHCKQAYRWQLDQVIDTHGNNLTYGYRKLINKYGRNNRPEDDTEYDRDGFLEKIEYGTRGATGRAPMRVLFGVGDRCLADCAAHHDAAHWPDVPWDRECTAATCGLTQNSPAFFSTHRLTSVVTQVLDGLDYRDVERWTLSHSFPSSDQPALWLDRISHSGLVNGTASVPDVTFTGLAMPNRVDTDSDQYPAMNRYRMKSITSETGGRIDLNYTPRDCVKGTRVPDQNNLQDNVLRCYPVKWTPEWETKPINDFFHRYLISDVVEADLSGLSARALTHYDYVGDPAWHYTDDDGFIKQDYKTWSVWRGYGEVRTTTGERNQPGQHTVEVSRFFRGMHGDKLPSGTRNVQLAAVGNGNVPAVNDEDAYAGMVRETITYNGPTEVSASVTEPWQSDPTASRTINGFTVNARFAETKVVHTRTALDGGRPARTTTERVVYDGYGMPIEVEDLGDNAVSGDEKCTLTNYVRDTSGWIVDRVSRERSFAVNCSAAKGTGLTDDDVIDDRRFTYDPATAALVKTESMKAYNGGNPAYLEESSATYDDYGRVLTATDRRGKTTTTVYTPSTGGPLRETTVISPLGWKTITVLEPAWGVPRSTLDPNQRKTELEYDALGRLVNVWLPGRNRPQSASLAYDYVVRNNAPSVVVSKRLNASGGYIASYKFFDSLLRARQTQDPDLSGRTGAVVTDTFYDAAGRAYKTHDPYAVAVAASTNLFVPTGEIPSLKVTLFDGAGRTVADVKKVNGPPASEGGTELWRTTYGYGGDRHDVIPPSGGTRTSEFTDASGRTTELRQYHAGGSGYDKTTYQYNRKDQLTVLTDPAGLRWVYDYDLRGRQKTVLDPDQGLTTMAYNDFDDLLSTTDGRGTKLVYGYDTVGRKRTVREGSETGPLRAEWVYDRHSNGLDVLGKLVKTIRYHEGAQFVQEITAFHVSYQPLSVTHTIPATSTTTGLSGTYTYTYSYHPDGSPATVRIPGAGDLTTETLTLGYNNLGAATTVGTNLGTAYVSGTEYTSLGELGVIHLRHNNSAELVDIAREYDRGTRRLTGILTKRSTAPGTVADVRYTYDPAGNVTKISDLAANDHQCFRMDHQRRLTQAWTPADGDCAPAPTAGRIDGPASYWHSYAYDAIGNRTSLTQHGAVDKTTTYAVKPGTHQLASAGAANYTYDPAGNTLTRPGPGGGTQNLQWDAEGHLASSTDSTGTTSYVYDVDGNRLVRKDPTGATLYLPGQELRAGGGTLTCTRYYTHQGHTIATRTAAGVTWLSGDHHGTAQVTIEARGQKTAIRRETPFGEQRAQAGDWPSTMDKGFVGGTKDNTGLIHLGAREYDPAIGRFISVDPVMDQQDPQQLHGYSYANNSPVSASDPDGLWPDFVDDAIDDAGEFIGDVADTAVDIVSDTAETVVHDAVTGGVLFFDGVNVILDGMYEYSDVIAAGFGGIALGCAAFGIGPCVAVAGTLGWAFAIVAAHKSCSGGWGWECGFGIAGAFPLPVAWFARGMYRIGKAIGRCKTCWNEIDEWAGIFDKSFYFGGLAWLLGKPKQGATFQPPMRGAGKATRGRGHVTQRAAGVKRIPGTAHVKRKPPGTAHKKSKPKLHSKPHVKRKSIRGTKAHKRMQAWLKLQRWKRLHRR